VEWILQYPPLIQWSIMIVAGVMYGGLIGLIPAAGPSKALILLFVIVNHFDFTGGDYLFVLFSITTVVAASTGDSFASVLIGIPGAMGSAATMLDGFPLAKQGKASYALSAAITTSTVNGLFWGVIAFMIIPYYQYVIKYVQVPEIFALVILAFCLISAVTTNHMFRSFVAIGVGSFVGLIGIDILGNPRFVFGLEYLEDGIPIIIVAAGLFAIPELYEALMLNSKQEKMDRKTHNKQTWDGIKEVWTHKWLALQGGAIGMVVGMLPGTSGGIGDWTAYSTTVSQYKNEKIPFGKGNIKGVIGPEGANNSGKAGALIPTLLFGIPGGKAMVILMALWMSLGFHVDNIELMTSDKFINHIFGGFLVGTLLTGIVCLVFTRYISKVVYFPARYWVTPLFLLTIWAVVASRYYVYLYEDILTLGIFGVLGFVMSKYKFSRPAFLMSFILAERFEGSFYQTIGIFEISELIVRPIFVTLIFASIGLVIWKLRSKHKLSYT